MLVGGPFCCFLYICRCGTGLCWWVDPSVVIITFVGVGWVYAGGGPFCCFLYICRCGMGLCRWVDPSVVFYTFVGVACVYAGGWTLLVFSIHL